MLKIFRVIIKLNKNIVWNLILLINIVFNLVFNKYFILINSIKEFVNDNIE